MATMNISLPDSMKSWAEQQAESGRYSNTSDYVRDLIRKDQDRQQKIDHLQALVSEGVASGVGLRSMDELRTAAKHQARDGKADELHSQQEGCS
ncbi:MAG: type II toxin-antitoxin system ParD family antitoxin [Pseudomonadota bacterium]|nr:type II toxin-antitoxin system ParD family antitoxin [Pseudomonadota bacterium]